MIIHANELMKHKKNTPCHHLLPACMVTLFLLSSFARKSKLGATNAVDVPTSCGTSDSSLSFFFLIRFLKFSKDVRLVSNPLVTDLLNEFTDEFMDDMLVFSMPQMQFPPHRLHPILLH